MRLDPGVVGAPDLVVVVGGLDLVAVEALDLVTAGGSDLVGWGSS